MKIETIPVNCIADLGPTPEPPDAFGSTHFELDPDCAEKFEFCASRESAVKLAIYIKDVQTYIRTVKNFCDAEEENEE